MKTQIKIKVSSDFDVVKRDAEKLFSLRSSGDFALEINQDRQLAKDSFVLEITGTVGSITAADLGGAYAGLGALLRSADWSGEKPVWPETHCQETPELPLRHMLIPGHFGNVYECMGRNEMRDFLLDMRLSGGNGYVDRFDMGELTNPFQTREGHSAAVYSVDLLQRKAKHWLNAQELGMDTGITLNPNHVYIEQWQAGLSAEYGGKYIGNLLCPSSPEARATIIRNWQELYDYLAGCGIKMTHVRPAPFDDGGCACSKCEPYYKTFLELTAEIAPHFLKHWPDVEGYLSGWWTNEEEQAILREFCESGKADWLKHYLFSTSYNITEMPVDLPEQIAPLQYSSFVHCAFTKTSADKYNSGGLHTAVDRLSSLLRQYPGAACNGYMGYTEGTESHLNLHIANRLAYALNCDTTAELAGYGRWFFGLNQTAAEKLAGIIVKSEAMLPETGQDLLQELNALKPKILPGREYIWELLKSKLVLLDMEHRARTQPETLANLAEEFYAHYEYLSRYVWRTGPMRHVLTEADRMPDWLKEYQKTACPVDRQTLPVSGNKPDLSKLEV